MWVTANAPPTPNSRPVMGVRGSAAFNLLPHHKNRRAQALLRHLCLEKGSFIWDLMTKALFGSGGVDGHSGIGGHEEPPGDAVANLCRHGLRRPCSGRRLMWALLRVSGA